MSYVPINISGLFPIVPNSDYTCAHHRGSVPTGTIIDSKVVSQHIHTNEVQDDGEGKKVLEYGTVQYRYHTWKRSHKRVFGIRATLSVGYGSLRENHATDAVPYIHLRLPVKGVDQFLSKLSKADQAPSPYLYLKKSTPQGLRCDILPWGLCVGFGSLNIMVRFAIGLVF